MNVDAVEIDPANFWYKSTPYPLL